MRLKTVGVSNYRNILFARLDLDTDRVFLLGQNGQGKTNLLESIGYVTALRAFRTRDSDALIGPRGSKAEIVYEIRHEELGDCRARVKVKSGGREVALDGDSVRRASDFVGRFPSVVLTSEDLSIVRGSPSIRRRYFDTFLCGVDRVYYSALQIYQKAVKERNALLKQESDLALMRSFETQLVESAFEVIARRRKLVDELSEWTASYYGRLSGGVEEVGFRYCPNVSPERPEAYADILERNRKRDQVLQATSKGPHRDDFEFTLNERLAADYASDGQQRSIALSLAFATLAYWREHFDMVPVLLVDDVLGELDPGRRKRFWTVLEEGVQLIATGTELPKSDISGSWRVFEVNSGEFRLR